MLISTGAYSDGLPFAWWADDFIIFVSLIIKKLLGVGNSKI